MAKKSLKVNLVGMRYHSPPFHVHSTIQHHPISLEREPHNPHDANAVRVLVKGYMVGHLDRESASIFSPLLAKGIRPLISVADKDISPLARTIHLRAELEMATASPVKPASGVAIGIYRIRICEDRWVYIGQSTDINKRIAAHWKDLGFGNHSNKALTEKWNQFGASSFSAEVVEYAPKGLSDLEQQRWLGAREEYWISKARKASNCVNVQDGEIVATKRARAEFDSEEKQLKKEHDNYVRARKKEIKLQIQQINAQALEPRERQGTALQNFRRLEQFIRSNTGIRGFFFGSAPQTIVNLKKVELELAKAYLAKAKAAVSEFDAKIAKLKAEYSRLKTTKQREREMSRTLFSAGVYSSPRRGIR